MKKEERIRRYGEEAYEKKLQQSRNQRAARREEVRAADKEWRENNPEKVILHHRESSRKGGKYYEQEREHKMKGIPHEKALVRDKHRYSYRPYKRIVAPDSQLHHEWVPGTADYRGVALVEKDQHQYGIIDVIQILEGEITLLTEEKVRNAGGGSL